MFRNFEFKSSQGFTITELVVSVSIFASTLTIMMVLLNYTLKIQRQADAMRQASQGMRNFTEFLVKEIRDSRIDYGVSNGISKQPTKSPCPFSDAASVVIGANTFGNPASGSSLDLGYAETRLPLINSTGGQECLFWAKESAAGVITPATLAEISAGQAKHLALAKSMINGYEKINPSNMTVDYLRFYIRPQCDPYTPTCVGGLPRTQPYVTIVARFNVTLGTGEKVIIPYQTTISTDDYAIPHS